MSTATTDTEVARLVDRADITDVVHRLGVCLDEGRFDEMRTLFVDDATARTPGGTAEGRDALVEQASRNHPSDRRIQHMITNVVVDQAGDAAEVRANLVVHFAQAGDAVGAPATPLGYTLGEVYRFRAVRTAGGWRLARVEAEPVWTSGSPVRPS
jgi:hypothetical protein